jgi:hypothetical protein
VSLKTDLACKEALAMNTSLGRRQLIRTTLFISFVLLASACGQSTSSVKQAAPSVAAVAPVGGQVPARLQGDWLLPPAAALAYQKSSGDTCPAPLAVATCMFKLSFTASSYNFEINAPGRTGGGGDAVVNGAEIDFFNGQACSLELPEGVGRYTWTLTGGVLHFTPLNQDPCPRAPILANESYSRAG